MDAVSLNSLPLGFRFRPTDEELVDFYLRLKINGKHEAVGVIREIDVCKLEPWDLPAFSIVKSNDPEWFFFCPVDRKYPNGHRLNRATKGGYWKATGKDRKVLKSKLVIGHKKTLVFYTGRAPKGQRTHWVMHEYHPTLDELDGTKPGQTPYVLCRLFRKQDESTQVVISEEETEHTVSPPITVQSSPELTQSDLAQCQESPVNIVVSDIQLPVQCQSNCCNSSEGGPQISDLSTSEDQQLEAILNWLSVSPPEPLDDNFFPPVHSPLQTMMQSSYSNHPISDLRTIKEVDVQYSHNLKEPDTFVSEFVESLLNQSDDYLCVESSVGKNPVIQSELVEKMTSLDETHTSSQRDAKFAQAAVTCGRPTWDSNVCQEQRNAVSIKQSCNPQRAAQISATNQLLTNQMNETDSGEFVTTGIKIRVRKPQDEPRTVNAESQGNASRRIHLQGNFQIHPGRFGKNSSDGAFNSGNCGLDLNKTKEVKESESDTHEPSIFETGRSSKFSHELGHHSGRNMRTQTGALKLIRVPSVFSKVCPAHDPVWSVVLFSVVAVVVVLFVILVSSRRCLILEIA